MAIEAPDSVIILREELEVQPSQPSLRQFPVAF
ncbi:hypothetical protein HX871_17275 [Pseudomonas reactans]|uniref:Uncharacterized protein n=1 Tax=Pseudomonas reactans TaxID=117680 RepID=A0ABX2QXW6_9PSED|nr:hypothetical protein [Pseudomonas reactans]NWD96180.1 hypothetical protein [Pseudomonas reactans]